MRQVTIKGLEKVKQYQEKIVALLDKMEENTYWHDEPFNADRTVHSIVREFYVEACETKRQYEAKLNAFKSL